VSNDKPLPNLSSALASFNGLFQKNHTTSDILANLKYTLATETL